MVIMENNPTAIRVPIDSLAPLASSVKKTLFLKSPNEFLDWPISEKIDHRETAIAGSLNTSIRSEGEGPP